MLAKCFQQLSVSSFVVLGLPAPQDSYEQSPTQNLNYLQHREKGGGGGRGGRKGEKESVVGCLNLTLLIKLGFRKVGCTQLSLCHCHSELRMVLILSLTYCSYWERSIEVFQTFHVKNGNVKHFPCAFSQKFSRGPNSSVSSTLAYTLESRAQSTARVKTGGVFLQVIL